MTPFKNGSLLTFAKLLLAFTLGAGTAVAAAYSTFETTDAHRTDQERTERMLEEIRGDVKTLLGRTAPTFQIPKSVPPKEGYGKPPLPQLQVKAR